MSATSSLMVRKRGAKINANQKKILLQSMVDNPLVYSRKLTAEFTIHHHRAFWQNICAVLNVYGPPKKTIESWKKVWKDIRCRYTKVGIGLKEIIGILKSSGYVVDTKFLLEKADQIYTSMKGKGDIEQALRESILSKSDNPECMLFSIEEPCTPNERKLACNLPEVKLKETRTILDLMDPTEEMKYVDPCALETKNPEDDDICEIAYEEIIGSDFEDICDSDEMDLSDTSVKRKLNSKQNGFATTDDSELELEIEILKRDDSVKKSKLSPESLLSNAIPSSSNYSNNTESTNAQNSSVLNDLLAELRQHNKIQKEKLDFNKKRFETKKKLLEHSLSLKKEIARAHNTLAKSIKTFIDNISYNT